MELWPYGTGPSRRRSTCAKDRTRAKMGHEQSKRDRARERRRKQRDIASEESKAKAKILTDTRTTLRSLSETLQTTALLSSPLYLVPAPSTYTLHVVTTDIYFHISGYSSARGILCACVFLVFYTELTKDWLKWVDVRYMQYLTKAV